MRRSGDLFAVHPLELTTFKTIFEDGEQWTICVNAFQPQLSIGSTDLDFLLGDIFMRNVYSMSVDHYVPFCFFPLFMHARDRFNYGDVMSQNRTEPPSIQFLSRTNQSQAHQEFLTERKINLESRPPLYDISKINAAGDDSVLWVDL